MRKRAGVVGLKEAICQYEESVEVSQECMIHILLDSEGAN